MHPIQTLNTSLPSVDNIVTNALKIRYHENNAMATLQRNRFSEIYTDEFFARNRVFKGLKAELVMKMPVEVLLANTDPDE